MCRSKVEKRCGIKVSLERLTLCLSSRRVQWEGLRTEGARSPEGAGKSRVIDGV